MPWSCGACERVSVATRIVAVRHGETAWNVDTRLQGHQDIALNATGRWQAECVARALADEGIVAIYTSDLQRAFDTAQAISRVIGVPVVSDRRLRERAFGGFETLTHADIESRWPEPARRWRQGNLRGKEKSLPDHGLLLSTQIREEVSNGMGWRSDTVCCVQAKRAMCERQDRFLPGWGIG